MAKKRRRSPIDSLGTKGEGTPSRRDIALHRRYQPGGDGRNEFKLDSKGRPLPGVVGQDPSYGSRGGGDGGGGGRSSGGRGEIPRPKLGRPFEGDEAPTPKERAKQINGNVRREVVHGRTGHVPGLSEAAREYEQYAATPYVEDLGGRFSGAARLTNTYARDVGADLPLDLQIAMIVHYRVWLLLMLGAATRRLEYLRQAIDLAHRYGSDKLLKDACAFLNWQIDEWEREFSSPEHRREVLEDFVREHRLEPVRKIVELARERGLKASERTVFRIKAKLRQK